MIGQDNANLTGEVRSPGGFVFGVQGWVWGDQQPRSITFFLDGTAKVSDHHGRPIKGVQTADGHTVLFATSAPQADDMPDARIKFASHAQVIAALVAERIDWTKLTWSGWPQLPYDLLKKLDKLPPTPAEELLKIRDKGMRKDALRMRKEWDDARAVELLQDED